MGSLYSDGLTINWLRERKLLGRLRAFPCIFAEDESCDEPGPQPRLFQCLDSDFIKSRSCLGDCNEALCPSVTRKRSWGVRVITKNRLDHALDGYEGGTLRGSVLCTHT